MAKEIPVLKRLWAKIHVNESGCWVFSALSSAGYGSIYYKRRTRATHALMWEISRGAVEANTELDHLCRNRACCNPDHLEPVTHQENMLRSPITIVGLNSIKTHCLNGHPLAGRNLDSWALKRGSRACRECSLERARNWHHRNRDARLKKMREYKERTRGDVRRYAARMPS